MGSYGIFTKIIFCHFPFSNFFSKLQKIISVKIPIDQYETHLSKSSINLKLWDPQIFPIVMNGEILHFLMVTKQNRFSLILCSLALTIPVTPWPYIPKLIWVVPLQKSHYGVWSYGIFIKIIISHFLFSNFFSKSQIGMSVNIRNLLTHTKLISVNIVWTWTFGTQSFSP